MTPEQWRAFEPIGLCFHQDFELAGESVRDVLIQLVRYLGQERSGAFFAALAALLRESPDEERFRKAIWRAGAAYAPSRAEFADFLAWSSTDEARHEFTRPDGLRISFEVIHADLTKP